MRISFRVLLAAALGAAPLFAASAQADPEQKTEAAKQDAGGEVAVDGKAAADPVVCQRYKEIGSMLRSKKICMHKSEWEAQRRGDREDIERSQIQRGIAGNN